MMQFPTAPEAHRWARDYPTGLRRFAVVHRTPDGRLAGKIVPDRFYKTYAYGLAEHLVYSYRNGIPFH